MLLCLVGMPLYCFSGWKIIKQKKKYDNLIYELKKKTDEILVQLNLSFNAKGLHATAHINEDFLKRIIPDNIFFSRLLFIEVMEL